MADDTLKPMQDGDTTPPTGTNFEPDGPLKDTGTGFEAASDTKSDGSDAKSEGSSSNAKATGDADEGGQGASEGAKALFAGGAGKLQQQAYDKVRMFAEDGKAKAGGLLDQLAQMLTDAAGTVDEKLGDQYGHYARNAAGTVTGFADQVRAKDLDSLIEDARGYVQKSPAAAVGFAAAFGFVAARLIQSGFDADKG